MDPVLMISFGVLIVILLAQQFFYMKQIQVLIDKLMCRSLVEYKGALAPKVEKIRLPDEYEDDGLRALDEIRGGLM